MKKNKKPENHKLNSILSFITAALFLLVVILIWGPAQHMEIAALAAALAAINVILFTVRGFIEYKKMKNN